MLIVFLVFQFVHDADNFIVLVNARQTITIKCELDEISELRRKLGEAITDFAEQDQQTRDALKKENTTRRLNPTEESLAKEHKGQKKFFSGFDGSLANNLDEDYAKHKKL